MELTIKSARVKAYLLLWRSYFLLSSESLANNLPGYQTIRSFGELRIQMGKTDFRINDPVDLLHRHIMACQPVAEVEYDRLLVSSEREPDLKLFRKISGGMDGARPAFIQL